MQKTIKFFRPIKTIPISITSDKCALNCAHCGGHFLKTMIEITKVEVLCKDKEVSSCLISGGCNKAGTVPFNSYGPEIKKLKEKYKINLHTGMLKESDLVDIKEVADVISFDIPASDNIVKDVYGLNYKVSDYVGALEKIRDEVKAVPHLCLGLGINKHLKDELSMVEKISQQKPDKLCIIIFTPVKGTRFQDKMPPDINAVYEFFINARKIMPESELILGCMRPGSQYRKEIDSIAVELGIDGIVMPARTAVKKAEQKGLRIIWKEECCAF